MVSWVGDDYDCILDYGVTYLDLIACVGLANAYVHGPCNLFQSMMFLVFYNMFPLLLPAGLKCQNNSKHIFPPGVCFGGLVLFWGCGVVIVIVSWVMCSFHLGHALGLFLPF